MKRAAIITLVMAMATAVLPAQETAKDLTVRSLLLTAQDLFQTPQARARAGRLVAVAEYIESLKPSELIAKRFLYEIDVFRNDQKNAREQAQAIFDAQPENYAAAMRWLDSQIEALQTAPARIEFLSAIVNNTKYSNITRSQAALKLYPVFLGIGDETEAAETIKQSVSLDPLNADALAAQLLGDKAPSNELKAEAYLGIINFNPRNTHTIWMMGKLLAGMGLSKQALYFYDSAWKIESDGKSIVKMQGNILIDYINAMLSAGEAELVWKTFYPISGKLKNESVFQGLLIEAGKASDQSEADINKLVTGLKNHYTEELTETELRESLSLQKNGKTKDSPQTALARMDMAAFYLVEQDSPKRAIHEMENARKCGAKGDMADLIESCAKLKENDVKALADVKVLVDKYPIACVFLADYYVRADDKAKAVDAITKGLSFERGDRATRALKCMAEKIGMKVPPAKDTDKVESIIAGFNRDVFELAYQPQNYISLSIKTVDNTPIVVGKPILVEVTLTNTGRLPISIGPGGMLQREVMLSAAPAGKPDETFMANPTVFLPAPRCLMPGKSVSGRTRLDTGHIDCFLTSNPMETVKLEVKAFLNPQQTPKGLVSNLNIAPAVANVQRAGLLAKALTPNGYDTAVAGIKQKISSGDQNEKYIAARQVGAVVTYARMVDLKEITAPVSIAPAVTMDSAAKLLNYALASTDPLVRAETITSMQYVIMGPELMNEFGPIIQDPDAYVRFRLVELLGNIGGKANMDLMPMFLEDKNPYVRMMANAFVVYEKELLQNPGK